MASAKALPLANAQQFKFNAINVCEAKETSMGVCTGDLNAGPVSKEPYSVKRLKAPESPISTGTRFELFLNLNSSICGRRKGR